MVSGQSDYCALKVDEVGNDMRRDDGREDDFEHDDQDHRDRPLPQERREPQTDDEPDGRLELKPQA